MIRSDANASAFALPAQGTVARCRLASFVASEARTMMSLKSFGKSRARRPDVDSRPGRISGRLHGDKAGSRWAFHPTRLSRAPPLLVSDSPRYRAF
jgi:hypothetical protein